MKIIVTGIEWDTSDFTEEEELASGVCVPDLPEEVEVEVSREYDKDEILRLLTQIYETRALDCDVDYDGTVEEDYFDKMVCGDGTEFCIG